MQKIKLLLPTNPWIFLLALLLFASPLEISAVGSNGFRGKRLQNYKDSFYNICMVTIDSMFELAIELRDKGELRDSINVFSKILDDYLIQLTVSWMLLWLLTKKI